MNKSGRVKGRELLPHFFFFFGFNCPDESSCYVMCLYGRDFVIVIAIISRHTAVCIPNIQVRFFFSFLCFAFPLNPYGMNFGLSQPRQQKNPTITVIVIVSYRIHSLTSLPIPAGNHGICYGMHTANKNY